MDIVRHRHPVVATFRLCGLPETTQIRRGHGLDLRERASDPEAPTEALHRHAPDLVRVGLETGFMMP